MLFQCSQYQPSSTHAKWNKSEKKKTEKMEEPTNQVFPFRAPTVCSTFLPQKNGVYSPPPAFAS